MTDPLKRREFIKTLSLAGVSIAIADPVSAKAHPDGGEINEIKNDRFTVSFDKKKGTINIRRAGGEALLTGGTVCTNFNSEKYFVSPGNFKFTFDSKNFTDQLGAGRRLIVQCKDKVKGSDMEIQLSLYDRLEAITIEAICKNVSNHDSAINSIEPLRVLKSEGGTLNVPRVSKCITNGLSSTVGSEAWNSRDLKSRPH